MWSLPSLYSSVNIDDVGRRYKWFCRFPWSSANLCVVMYSLRRYFLRAMCMSMFVCGGCRMRFRKWTVMLCYLFVFMMYCFTQELICFIYQTFWEMSFVMTCNVMWQMYVCMHAFMHVCVHLCISNECSALINRLIWTVVQYLLQCPVDLQTCATLNQDAI